MLDDVLPVSCAESISGRCFRLVIVAGCIWKLSGQYVAQDEFSLIARRIDASRSGSENFVVIRSLREDEDATPSALLLVAVANVDHVARQCVECARFDW